MDNLFIIVIIALLLIIFNSKKSNHKNTKTEQQAGCSDLPTDKNETETMIFPYKRKYLLTKAEYSFYKILKDKCDNENMLICPKVRIEDFISVSTKENVNKYRGYIKSRHVDFVICDDNLNILVAVELDDNSHNKSSVAKTDEFKNKLFETVGIPLIRVKMSDGYYENAIDKLLGTAKSLVK